MNSAYGKCIQKPIKDSYVYKKHLDKGESPYDKYLCKNSAKIIDCIDINSNISQIKISKQIDDFASNTLLGVQILSMSKRIMNEVMCTAEDLGIKIFYQDTDSMHIEKGRLNELAIEYKKRYPETSLGELADIVSLETDKSITKSGINHHFRKIKDLVNKDKNKEV